MKKKLIVFSILIVCLLGSGNLSAGGLFFIGIQGGWSQQSIDIRDFEFDKNTTFLYGARVGVRILMLAVEGNFYQAAHDIKASDVGNLWDSRQIDYNYLGINVRLFLPLPIVNPYLTLGYGTYSADIEDIGEDKSGGWNAGLGAEVFLGEKFSLLGEARYNYGSFEIETVDIKIRSFTFHIGINFGF
ncbi:MAG: porin family protein [Candidatus Aminicenantes bacterium]|jgi:opacity protein-like surface antigen